MEDIQEFETKLKQKLQEKKQELDSSLLPAMQKDIQLMVSACNTVLSALIKKSIFHNSSSRYAERPEEIIPPSTEPFNDKESSFALGGRFGQYTAMIEFASQYYQYNCDFFTPQKIAKLTELLKSFNWDSLVVSSSNPNTSSFAELLQNFRRCGDPLAINIVSDGLSQLSKALSSSMRVLKSLSCYHREAYKLSVRENVFSRLDLSGNFTDVESGLKAVKKVFAQTMKGSPFYTDLIKEILEENYGNGAERRRQEVLSSLDRVVKAEERKEEPEIDYRAELFYGIRMLGSVSPHLTVLISKLSENQKILQAARMTFFKKLKELFRKAFNIPVSDYEITMLVTDPATQVQKRETISFNMFIENLRRKARLFNGFALKGSAVWQKLEAMDNVQLLDILSKNLSEMNTIMRQCGGLDDYFKKQAGSELKTKIKGIKIEISTIKNTILKVNRIRADFSARIEEQEQLKRLGILNEKN